MVSLTWMSLASLAACGPEGTSPRLDDTGPAVEPVTAEEVWAVSGGAGDLAWDGSALLATAALGDAVLRWDPETDQDSEIGTRLGGSPTAVAVGPDGTIYVAVSDSGVEAIVGVLEDLHTLRVLATAAGSALFRRPVDLALGADGVLVVADNGAEAVWRVPTDGSPATVAFSNIAAEAVGWHEGELYVATDEAVWVADGDTLTEHVTRAVRALGSWQGALLGTTQDGLVRVGDGAVLMGLDAGRPAALQVVGDTVWVADESGGRVWRADLGASGD